MVAHGLGGYGGAANKNLELFTIIQPLFSPRMAQLGLYPSGNAEFSPLFIIHLQ
jgi:hypothetical protein